MDLLNLINDCDRVNSILFLAIQKHDTMPREILHVYYAMKYSLDFVEVSAYWYCQWNV